MQLRERVPPPGALKCQSLLALSLRFKVIFSVSLYNISECYHTACSAVQCMDLLKTKRF